LFEPKNESDSQRKETVARFNIIAGRGDGSREYLNGVVNSAFIEGGKSQVREPTKIFELAVSRAKKNPPAASHAGATGHFIFTLSTNATSRREYAN
jgi:hypothetical protein